MSKFKSIKRHPAAVAIATAGLLLTASLWLVFAERCQAVHQQTRPRRVTTKGDAQNMTSVRKGDDLQAAIDKARCGETISVEAGASFAGNFYLPVKPCSDASVVIIQSSRVAELREGVRVSPAEAALMPKIQTPNNEPALSTRPGAHHYRLVGLEIVPAHPNFMYDVVSLGDPTAAQNTSEKIPHHLTVDRCYIHANGEQSVVRGIDLNANDSAVTNSHVSGFKATGTDTQAVLVFNAEGRILIENNYLEASGENIMVGGADAKVQDMVPSDITIRRNHLAKPLSWRGVWLAKNLLELKNARRVTIDGNLLENSWASGQAGYAIVFTVRNQEGTNPWAVVSDVEFTNNIVRNAASGVQILGLDNLNPSQVTRNIRISNNVFESISTSWGPGLANKLFLIVDGPENVEITRNTVTGDAPALYFSGKPAKGLKVTGNAFGAGTIASEVGNGRAALEAFAPGARVAGNSFAGVFRPDLYPAGNAYPETLPAILPAGVGCDLTTLKAAQGAQGRVSQPAPSSPFVGNARHAQGGLDGWVGHGGM